MHTPSPRRRALAAIVALCCTGSTVVGLSGPAAAATTSVTRNDTHVGTVGGTLSHSGPWVRIDGGRKSSATPPYGPWRGPRAGISVNRAVARTTTAPSHGTGTKPTTATTVAFRETGEGASLRPYASTSLNRTNPLWHVEPGSAPVDRVAGKITKVDPAQFHRMFSTKRFGGPGKSLKVSYRGRATSIRDRDGSSIVEGAKVGLKFPVSSSLTGYSKEDVRSVYGNGTQNDGKGPGSYAFLTGLTEGGYIELSRNGYGAAGYKFFANKRLGYTVGAWKDVTITVEWLSATAIRIRYWQNASGTGAPVYEVTDTKSPFASEPGFLWLRTDDADWEYEHLTVEESPRGTTGSSSRPGAVL